MTKVLVLKSSILGGNSASNTLIDQFLDTLQAEGASLATTVRDFAVDPIPQWDQDRLAALMTPADQRDSAQQAAVALADQLIDEVQQADLLVIGAPMYNFTVPTSLKSWVDHVARAGVTFRYTAEGPQGLLTGKRVVVVATMGGRHEPGETDHLRPYLKTVLNFLGLDQIDFVAAGGLNLGEEPRAQALRQASERLVVLAQKLTDNEEGKNSREAA